MKETKNYSAESIRTIIDQYMKQNKVSLYKELDSENRLLKFQIEKAQEAMRTLLNLMEQGFNEAEAWEIVSKDVVYF